MWIYRLVPLMLSPCPCNVGSFWLGGLTVKGGVTTQMLPVAFLIIIAALLTFADCAHIVSDECTSKLARSCAHGEKGQA